MALLPSCPAYPNGSWDLSCIFCRIPIMVWSPCCMTTARCSVPLKNLVLATLSITPLNHSNLIKSSLQLFRFDGFWGEVGTHTPFPVGSDLLGLGENYAGLEALLYVNTRGKNIFAVSCSTACFIMIMGFSHHAFLTELCAGLLVLVPTLRRHLIPKQRAAG